jgi:hypothetical protein
VNEIGEYDKNSYDRGIMTIVIIIIKCWDLDNANQIDMICFWVPSYFLTWKVYHLILSRFHDLTSLLCCNWNIFIIRYVLILLDWKKTLFGYWGSNWKWGFTCGATCISQRKTSFYVFHLETEVMVMVW